MSEQKLKKPFENFKFYFSEHIKNTEKLVYYFAGLITVSIGFVVKTDIHNFSTGQRIVVTLVVALLISSLFFAFNCLFLNWKRMKLNKDIHENHYIAELLSVDFSSDLNDDIKKSLLEKRKKVLSDQKKSKPIVDKFIYSFYLQIAFYIIGFMIYIGLFLFSLFK